MSRHPDFQVYETGTSLAGELARLGCDMSSRWVVLRLKYAKPTLVGLRR